MPSIAFRQALTLQVESKLFAQKKISKEKAESRLPFGPYILPNSFDKRSNKVVLKTY